MVKQVKTASELDRISNLPDPIISHILSFLPTKTAVRTSILSSRWKYHYVSSISTLDFRNCLRDVPRKNWSNFNSFVDRLFFYPKQASLECFKVNSYSWDADYQRLYGWLCAAMWHGRGIKEIEIFSLDKNVLILPSLLFTCHSLVSLKLEVSLCEMNVPANVCLPNLKILHLERFEFPDGHSILKLISTCHALEDLDFIECKFHNIIELNIHSLSLKRLVLDFDYPVWKGGRHYDYSIVINAPSLVYFRYFDLLVKGFALSDMKCLEEADVKILQYSGREDELSAARHLLQRIGNVKSLRFFVDDFEELFRTCVNSVFAFHNLIELEFHEYCGYWRGRWLLEFLHRVPNLKILKLNFYPPNEGIRSISNEVPCPSCLLFHLKEIKMSNFVDEQPMLELVGYFLKHGLVLENLIIDTAGELSTEEMILSFHRESKKCKVRIV